MSSRPAHEPINPFRPAQRLLDEAVRNPPALGCLTCPDYGVCGGLHIEAGVFDCTNLCACADPTKCDMVCRNRPDQFFDRYQEVGGFDLGTVQRVRALPVPALPAVIPLIPHKYSRHTVLPESIVALSLYDLFHMGTGEPLARTRAELAERFLIPTDATLVVTGVDRDAKLEAWWSFENRKGLVEALRALDVALVTGPNFSLFTDTPRPDNLHSIKRIAMSWAELMAGGVATALHLNARTDHDYRRWAQFIRERPEATVVAFEFGTGAGYRGRMDWHVERLCALAKQVRRPLTLVLRGGVPALERLRAAFDKVILIETDAFPRTRARRRAVIDAAGRLRWKRVTTEPGAPLDELLAHNISTHRTHLMSVSPSRPLRLVRPAAKRATKHAHSQAGQGSLVPDFDLSLQGGTVPFDLQDMIVAAKA